jgi:protein-disulfide isomerase
MEAPSNNTLDQKKSTGISPLSFVLALITTLVIGGIIGYGLGLSQAAQNPEVVVVTATPDPQAIIQATPSPTSPPAADDSNDAAPTPSIMDLLLADARHFQGNADAPVTIVEFSDFK